MLTKVISSAPTPAGLGLRSARSSFLLLWFTGSPHRPPLKGIWFIRICHAHARILIRGVSNVTLFFRLWKSKEIFAWSKAAYDNYSRTSKPRAEAGLYLQLQNNLSGSVPA